MACELPRTSEILNFREEKGNISKARWRHATAVKHYFPIYNFRHLPVRHDIPSDVTLTCQPGCIKILCLASNTSNDHRVWYKELFRML